MPALRTHSAATWPTQPARLPPPHARARTQFWPSRGQWVTNEKTLIDQADLRGIDEILTGLTPLPAHLLTAVDSTAELLCVSLD